MEDDEIISVWVSKYALSKGILHMKAERSRRFPSLVVNPENRLQTFHEEGREWHLSEADAQTRADAMRQAKIVSLRKQIARLERLDFGVSAHV
jgi:hypothetical protein